MGKNNEVKQSIVTDITYTVPETAEWYAEALASTDPIKTGIATLIPNIGKKRRLGFVSGVSGLQGDNLSCAWNALGDITLYEKTFEIKRWKINKEECFRTLKDKFENADQVESDVTQIWIDDTKRHTALDISRCFWIGDTGAATVPLNVADGILTQLADDATSELGVEVTGSISTTTLTVTAVDKGYMLPEGNMQYLKPGDLITGVNVAANTYIVEQLTKVGEFDGGIGTYTVSVSQTAASAPINTSTVIDPNPIIVASQSTTVMTVTKVLQGKLRVGQVISGGTFAANTTIVAQLTSTDSSDGGTGTYTVSNSATVASVVAKARFATYNASNALFVLQDLYAAIPFHNFADMPMPEFYFVFNPMFKKYLQQINKKTADEYGLVLNQGGTYKDGSGNTSPDFSQNEDYFLGVPIKYAIGFPANKAFSSHMENIKVPATLDQADELLALEVFPDQTRLTDKVYMKSAAGFGFGYIRGQHIIYTF